MAPQFDRPLRDLLLAAGCTMVRQGKGSHEIWRSPITRRNFAVPVGILSRHTANAILRQAGLPQGILIRGIVLVRAFVREPGIRARGRIAAVNCAPEG